MDGMNELGAGGLDLGSGADTPVKPAGGMEQCVPLESLGVPGEGEIMENPEVGDRVDYTVEGKVTRIEGGKAYVLPEAVNGKPIESGDRGSDLGAGDGLAGLEQAAGELGNLG